MLRVSLKSKAAIIVVLVFLGMMALVATVQTRSIRADLLKDIGTAQTAMVERAAKELDQKLETGTLALVREAAAIPAMTLSDPLSLQPYLEQRPTILLLFDGIFIFSPSGEVIATSPSLPVLKGSFILDREYFDRSMKTRAPVVSEPYVGRVSKNPFVTLTVPVTDSKGELVGFLAGYLDLLKANFIGGLASTSVGTSGHFFIITSGTPSIYVAHPDRDLVLKPSTDAGPAAANLRALQGFEGTTEAVDSNGQSGLYSYKRLSNTNWILAASYPSTEAFASAAAAQTRLWLISGVLAAVLAPLIWFLTSLLVSPLTTLSRDVQQMRTSQGAISTNVRARQDEIGELARAFHTLIREQQQTVEALRRSQQVLDNIVENIPASIQLKDVNDEFRVVMWNRAAEQMFAIPREQAIGRTTHRNWTPEDIEIFRNADLQAVAEGGQEVAHREITNARGERLVSHIRKVLLKDGDKPTHLLVIMDDITERVKAEQELRSNRAFLESLIDNAPVAIYVKDVRPETYGTMLVWNKHAEAIAGMTEEEMIGRKDKDVLDAEVYREIIRRDEEMFANPVVRERHDDPFHRRDGTLVFLHTISVPLLDDKGKPEFVLRISEDVTARRRQQKDLRSRTAELMAVSDASPLGMFRTDAMGRHTYANRSYQLITGADPDATAATAMAEENLHPEDHEVVLQRWRDSIATRQPFSSMHRYRHSDGQIVWASVRVAPVLVDGKVVGFVGSVDDITARRDAQHALQMNEHRLRTITDTMPAGVAYVDRSETYQFTNAAFEREFGVTRNEVRGKTVRQVVGEEFYAKVQPFMDQAFRGQRVTFERQRSTAEYMRWLETTLIPEYDEDGAVVVGFHAMLQDVTAKKIEEQRLLRLAQLDSLTGLANRVGFMQRLTDAMSAGRQSGEPLAVMYVDIDRFKQINDTHGHGVGDALLIEFARRLKSLLRKSDTVARLGGDEFVIVMERVVDADLAARLATKALEDIRHPFMISDWETGLSITASIGIAFYDGSSVTAETLLAEADSMLYAAKHAGRDQYRAATWPGPPFNGTLAQHHSSLND